MSAPPNPAMMGAAPPPPGEVVNLVDPPSIQYRIIVSTSVCMALAFASTFLRMYTRMFITRCTGADDYLILVALFCALGLNVATLILLKFGLGINMWNVPLSHFAPHFLKDQMAATLLYVPGIMFTKLSILFFYLRLTPQKTFRILVWTLMFVVVAYSIASDLANLLTCIPVAKAWNPMIEDGWCLNRVAFYFSNAAINVATDLCMILLPLPITYRLHIPRRQKVALTLVFMTASFVCIVSIIRLQSLKSFIHGTDVTYITLEPDMWSIIETNIGIMCANMPALRPLLGRSKSGRSYDHSGSNRQKPSNSYPLGSGGRDEPRDVDGFELATATTHQDSSASNPSDENVIWTDPEKNQSSYGPDGHILRTSEIAVSYGRP